MPCEPSARVSVRTTTPRAAKAHAWVGLGCEENQKTRNKVSPRCMARFDRRYTPDALRSRNWATSWKRAPKFSTPRTIAGYVQAMRGLARRSAPEEGGVGSKGCEANWFNMLAL